MKTNLCKIVVIGDSGVGKSSLIHKSIHGNFKSEYEITRACDCTYDNMITTYIHDKDVTVATLLWDIGGSELFNRMGVTLYFKNSSAAVVVIDVTRENTFNKALEWIKILKKYINDYYEDPRYPIMLCFNKLDLLDNPLIKKYTSNDECEQGVRKIITLNDKIQNFINECKNTYPD